jgi:hypothetical protein
MPASVTRTASRLGTALVLAALLPSLATAQSAPAPGEPGPWRFRASLYGYFPSVDGTSSTPADSGGTRIDVSAKKILDSIETMFMGSFDAHNGRWGVFTDFIYLSLGGSKQGSRDFTIGNAAPPASATANLDLELRGLSWTLAGEYRLPSRPRFNLDVLAGARLLDLRKTLSWDIAGELGPIQPEGRSGSSEAKIELWDGIVGLKGRATLGEMGRWSLPFYLDIGTGESDLTWQVAGGITYAFNWGELTAMWRHLAYEMKAGSGLESLSFNGPMIGATFRW